MIFLFPSKLSPSKVPRGKSQNGKMDAALSRQSHTFHFHVDSISKCEKIDKLSVLCHFNGKWPVITTQSNSEDFRFSAPVNEFVIIHNVPNVVVMFVL